MSQVIRGVVVVAHCQQPSVAHFIIHHSLHPPAQHALLNSPECLSSPKINSSFLGERHREGTRPPGGGLEGLAKRSGIVIGLFPQFPDLSSPH